MISKTCVIPVSSLNFYWGFFVSVVFLHFYSETSSDHCSEYVNHEAKFARGYLVVLAKASYLRVSSI